MKNLNTFLLTCVFSIMASIGFSATGEQSTEKPAEAPKETLTFKDALTAAYNLTYLSGAQYDVKAGHELLSAAKREWLPTTGIKSTYSETFQNTRSRNNPQNPGTSRDNIHTTGANLGLNLNQNLFAGGKTIAGIRAKKHAVDKAVAGYQKQESSLLFAAIQSYSNVVLKEAVLKVRIANQKVLEEQTTMAKTSNELGANTISDVAQVESKLAKIKAAVTMAKAELASAWASFEKLTGLAHFSSLEDPALPSVLPQSQEEAMQLALENNYDLKAVEADAEEAKETVKQVRADLLPNLDISAGVSRNLQGTWSARAYNVTTAGGFSKSSSSQFDAGATLSIPLDFRGSTQAGVRKVKYDAAKKRIDAINARRGVIEAVTSKWQIMEAKRKNIVEAKEQERTAKVAYDCMNEEFKEGMKTTLHLLTAEQEYFSAQIERLAAEQEHLQAAYELLKEIGTLTAQTLDLPVQEFDGSDYESPVWGLSIEE